jgi:hypothetical protein
MTGKNRRGAVWAAGRALLPLAVCAAIAGLAQPVRAQTPDPQSYQRRFIRAALSAKPEILTEAAAGEHSAEITGPLCEFALQFAIRNAEMLQDDPDMIALVSAAARGAGSAGYAKCVDTLWQAFAVYPDSRSRVEILSALGMLGADSRRVVENLNQYLAAQNRLFRAGVEPDYAALSTCIAALAARGDASSIPALFSVTTAAYPDALVEAAARALESMPDDYRRFLLATIRREPPGEKLAAFRAGAHNPRFTAAEQGQIAESALDQSLELFPGGADEAQALDALRYEAALAITRLRWTDAAAMAVRHFYRAQTDFQQGGERRRFVEAIDCLAVMGTADSALALALYLGLLNAEAEKDGAYDEDIILEVVRALGAIGDKSAFDYLLYVSYVSYPAHIQAAAREALGRLRW